MEDISYRCVLTELRSGIPRELLQPFRQQWNHSADILPFSSIFPKADLPILTVISPWNHEYLSNCCLVMQDDSHS